MWKDHIKLKRLKERPKIVAQKPKQTIEIRHGGSRAQDGILKYMLKLMEVCKGRGFVYGIIPKKGKLVMKRLSKRIGRRMWKDRIKLKRLKEGPKIAAQQATGKQKPKQTTEIRLRGSRA